MKIFLTALFFISPVLANQAFSASYSLNFDREIEATIQQTMKDYLGIDDKTNSDEVVCASVVFFLLEEQKAREDFIGAQEDAVKRGEYKNRSHVEILHMQDDEYEDFLAEQTKVRKALFKELKKEGVYCNIIEKVRQKDQFADYVAEFPQVAQENIMADSIEALRAELKLQTQSQVRLFENDLKKWEQWKKRRPFQLSFGTDFTSLKRRKLIPYEPFETDLIPGTGIPKNTFPNSSPSLEGYSLKILRALRRYDPDIAGKLPTPIQ